MNEQLKNFFYPNNLCVVGASSKPQSIGYEILRSIKEFNFQGTVFPINPKGGKILGFRCYGDIDDVKSNIDLAIVVVPKKFVMDSIEKLLIKGTKSIVLITAGFREIGEDGKELENELIKKIKEFDARMIGPNCMGVINTHESILLNATFVAEKPQKGGIGFLSQSGALGAAVLNSLRESNIRFSHFVSIGNKADVDELDIMQFWLDDDNIKTITFYLESIENGVELISSYISSNNKKPLIVLKAGKTLSGMKAASSHTGALSSNEKITGALLKQFGIIRVNNLNEMFNTAKGFESFAIPKGNKIAVVTNAGGPAILAVDKLEERGLGLAEFSNKTITSLKETVHPEGSIKNPVDLLPGGSEKTFKEVNEILLGDENVNAVISIFVEPVMVDAFSVIESVNSIKSEKPIYQVCMPLPEFWQKYNSESEYKYPIFRNPEDPAEIISNILHYESKRNKNYDFKKLLNKTRSEEPKTKYLSADQVNELCLNYNIPIASTSIIDLKNVRDLKKFDYPIVIKGLSEDLIHKSELDAVKLNIRNFEEANKAIQYMKNSFAKNKLELEQILVQPFIKIKHELLIGGFRDPSFGPVVMFGSGGKYVESLNDTLVCSALASDLDLDALISGTKIGKIIKGVRGESSINMDELKNIIKSVSSLMIENDNVLEIDINPLIVDEQLKLKAVDVRINKAK